MKRCGEINSDESVISHAFGVHPYEGEWQEAFDVFPELKNSISNTINDRLSK